MNHQRKLMQREYYDSRRRRLLLKRRAFVAGAFGCVVAERSRGLQAFDVAGTWTGQA